MHGFSLSDVLKYELVVGSGMMMIMDFVNRGSTGMA